MSGRAPSEFYDLRVVTPVIELRMAASDADFDAVAAGVSKQIHDPDSPPPFANDWTSREPGERAAKTIELLRENQSTLNAESWRLELSAFAAGDVVGGLSLRADDFSVVRMAEVGLWVGFDQQGKGIGRHIVVSALSLAFDHLRAFDVVYTALEHNTRSLALAERLGFEPNGHTFQNQHGERKRLVQKIMSRDHWTEVKRDPDRPVQKLLDEIEIVGADACRQFLRLGR